MKHKYSRMLLKRCLILFFVFSTSAPHEIQIGESHTFMLPDP